MALFTEDQLINRVGNEIRKSFSGGGRIINEKRKAEEFINESKKTQRSFSSSSKHYDIFLSHSSNDVRLVAGLKLKLEDLGYTVYIDWIEDPELDRSSVTKTNANVLRKRMHQCTTLMYAFSKNASTSTWMPWELGYFDGIKGLVAVVPISKDGSGSFSGNEYLQLYPYIDIEVAEGTSTKSLWVNEATDSYVSYDAWIKGKKPYKR